MRSQRIRFEQNVDIAGETAARAGLLEYTNHEMRVAASFMPGLTVQVFYRQKG
jgi:hypothetical protein